MKKVLLFLIIIQLFVSSLFSYVDEINLAEKKDYNIVLKSALCPGLGQYSTGYKSKAYLFAALTGISIIGSVYSYNEASSKYAAYEEQQYKNSDLYSEYNVKMDQMYSFIGLGLVTWIFNIYDAYKIDKKVNSDNSLKMSFINKKIYVSYSKRY